MSDEFSGQGGRYVLDKEGKRVRQDKPQQMPAGGGARLAGGKPLDVKPPAEHNTDSMPAPQGAPWSAPSPVAAPPAGASEPADDKKGKR